MAADAAANVVAICFVGTYFSSIIRFHPILYFRPAFVYCVGSMLYGIE